MKGSNELFEVSEVPLELYVSFDILYALGYIERRVEDSGEVKFRGRTIDNEYFTKNLQNDYCRQVFLPAQQFDLQFDN